MKIDSVEKYGGRECEGGMKVRARTSEEEGMKFGYAALAFAEGNMIPTRDLKKHRVCCFVQTSGVHADLADYKFEFVLHIP
jgi:hypothetical protein